VKINRKVFVLVSLAGVAEGAIGGFEMFLPLLLIQHSLALSQIRLYTIILSITTEMLIPAALFVCLYHAGKGLDMARDYVDLGFTVLIGYAVTYFVGFVSCALINLISNMEMLQILVTALTMGLTKLSRFFLGFSALSLSYFRRSV